VPRLQQALRIRRGEESTVARLLVFMFVAWAGAAIGSSAAESMFFARFGPRHLPYMWIVVGLITFPVMLAIGSLLARHDRRRVFAPSLIGLGLFVTALRGLLLIDARWVYPPLWLGMMVTWTALGTLTWGLAGSVHDTRQAKRLFPLYAAGAILGGAVGGFLTPPLAQFLHAENLLLVWVVTLVAAAIVATSVVGGRSRRRRLPGPRPKRVGLLESVLQGARYVRRSQLASWMSISIVLLNILYFSLTLPFAKAATDRFTDADSLSGFLGLFTGATNAVALLVSVGVANRLFARFGVPAVVLTFPFIYLLGFAVLGFAPGFAPLVTTRFVQWVWMYGVWATGWEALRGVVPTEWRGQVRTFMDGGPLQAGVILAGIFLLATQDVLTGRQFFFVAAGLAATAVAASWRLRRAYAEELVSALRAGWPEVFISEEDPVGGPFRDRVAHSTLIDGARDPQPGVRRLALEILARFPQAGGEAVVRERLEDEDAGVRLAALHAVGRSRAPEVLPIALRLLGDHDAHVRAAAANAVVTCSDGGIEVADRLRSLLVDPDAGVRVNTAASLVRIANDPEAIAVLEAAAKAPNFEDRAEAVDALADLRLRADLVADALRDEHPAVRRTAARALPTFGAEAATEPLLAALADDDPGVRDAVADALVNLDGKVASRVAEALEDEATEQAALRALVRLPDADDSTLRSYADHERDRACGYHEAWQQFAKHTDPHVQLLVEGLRHAALRHAEHAVLALAPFGEHRALDLAWPDLTSRDPNQRANAIETVDALADPAVVRRLLAIWEPQPASRPTGAEALRPLLRDEDPWIRACAVFSVSAFGDGRLEQTVRDLAENDEDATVRVSAGRALEGPPSMESLSTLSLMDRVLALSQVPLFRELAPADLKHVADAVVEYSYVDDTVIAEQGDPGDAMHVVVSGEVRVLMGGQEAAEVARRGPGYIVGEMAILGEQPRMANLLAVGEVKTLSIDRNRFQRILRERPDAALAVMRELSARLAEAHGASTT
jgi:HEAT repeat protein/MFS family permease